MQMIIKATDYDARGIATLTKGIAEAFPFAQVETIGMSVAGREILALRIGNGDKKTLYAGAFHGAERITSVVLLKFALDFCTALHKNKIFAGVDVRRAMQGRSLYIVPSVNPDGCEINQKGKAACKNKYAEIFKLCQGNFLEWSANFRGVDINHNFDAAWEQLHEVERTNGIFGPAPRRFGGPKPESEPETVALTNLCRQNDFAHVTAFHTQGEVIYYGFRKENAHCEKMAEIMSAVSGYKLDVPEGLSFGGGFKDWFSLEYERPAFTVELGIGTNPLPATDLDYIYNKTQEMLTVLAIM